VQSHLPFNGDVVHVFGVARGIPSQFLDVFCRHLRLPRWYIEHHQAGHLLRIPAGVVAACLLVASLDRVSRTA
jgi:hypothetical protein